MQHGIEKTPMKLITSVGHFSFFRENRSILVLTSCYKNLINFLIYIFLGTSCYENLIDFLKNIYIWVGEN